MTDQSVRLPRFVLTPPGPCPYVEDRIERKVFTELIGDNAQELNDALTQIGFRRSQNVLYKPACDECTACVSVRIPVKDFESGRGLRRIERRNDDLVEDTVSLEITAEQYGLMRRYLTARHFEGGMAQMDLHEFADMVERSPVDSFVMEYRRPAEGAEGDSQLVAACLCDVMEDGLSMVYSFFDPRIEGRSLGTYIILSHIKLARGLGLGYVYLGYWIDNCRKMAYKERFRPLEMLGPKGWVAFKK